MVLTSINVPPSQIGNYEKREIERIEQMEMYIASN